MRGEPASGQAFQEAGMRRMGRQETPQGERARFRLFEHPWISLVVMSLVGAFILILFGNIVFGVVGLPDDSPVAQFIQPTLAHVLMLFVIVPFVLRLPKGRRSFGQYLDDIRLSRTKPIIPLLLLALSAYLIMALSQATGTIVFRIFEGKPITGDFILYVLDITGDLPPESPSLLVAFPSIFEEIGSRGVVLTVFLRKYSERKAIVFSALGFGLMHLLNLLNGRELVWVGGQVVWAFILGLMYGYMFIKAGSLLPLMIIHYLGNVFIGSLTWYLQETAPIETQVLYNVIFNLGLVPVTLMIVWTRFFAAKWLPARE
jgi:membrane protease YdiL (CAAX protease family)